jgi:hypothetical protein
MLAVLVGVMVLVTLRYGCGKPSSIPKKQGEPDGTGQPESTAPEPSAQTQASGGASGNTSGEELAVQSEADCRLVLDVADKDMSRKEAEAFSELLADMIRTMEDPSSRRDPWRTASEAI